MPRMMKHSPTLHFLRHYGEMVLSMLIGMAVFGALFGVLFGPLGTSWDQIESDAPAAMLALMAFSMTVPMVGWMAYRGHSRAANIEMAGSMIVPTLGVIALLAAGVVDDSGLLLAIQHVVMFPAMLLVMLLRREEYTGHAVAAEAS
jgi:hypothetical protein